MRTLPCASLILSIFALPSFASITVSSPANATEVSSPFVLSANAPNCSSQNVAAIGYSLDDSTDTTIVNSPSVQASVTAAPGTHTLHVKAWGNQGAVCVSD